MNIFIKYYQSFTNATTHYLTIDDNNISVKQLKILLKEKYDIPLSNQRLTCSLYQDFYVLMTDSFPLSFFRIEENSIISLEYIKEVNKQEEIFKKVLSSTKSKYLKSLGFFNHFTTNLGVIRESQNEHRYESYVGNEHKESHLKESFVNPDEEAELLIGAVRNNNINEVKEILDNYNNSLDVNFKSKNGWAAIHFAAYYGFGEILIELLIKKADPNLLNKEGWAPMHLASYKGKDQIVRILLDVEDTDVNLLHKEVGTPLHIACRRSYLKIVSLLLLKADIE